MSKPTSTLKLDEQTIDDILTLLNWGLTDFDESEEEYPRFINLANRLERAKCRMNGWEFNESKKWR